MASVPIVFASDFGAGSEWVGVCHGVIASIAPETRVIDLAHTLPPFEPGIAGLTIGAALPYMPACIAVLVVDPGVGTSRRAIVARAGRGDLLVGPDNGLLPAAAEHIGGLVEARTLAVEEHVSSTFHGRDLFAPAAARLSLGRPSSEFGDAFDPAALVAAPMPLLEIGDRRVVCQVIDVDPFGNARLSARPASLESAGLGSPRSLHVRVASDSIEALLARTFGEVPPDRVAVIGDSFGWLSLCMHRASAASRLGISVGSRVELTV